MEQDRMSSTEPKRTAAEVRSAATQERLSGRAQRKQAAEEAGRKRRLYAIVGGLAAVAVLALIVFLVTRPRPEGPPVATAPALAAEIPTDGRLMGNPEAPVTVVEWGDYQ